MDIVSWQRGIQRKTREGRYVIRQGEIDKKSMKLRRLGAMQPRWSVSWRDAMLRRFRLAFSCCIIATFFGSYNFVLDVEGVGSTSTSSKAAASIGGGKSEQLQIIYLAHI